MNFLNSNFSLGHDLNRTLSQEEKNIILDATYLSWKGKRKKSNQRNLVFWDDKEGPHMYTPVPWYVEDTLTKVYSILKREFEKDRKEIENIRFIQENPTGKRDDDSGASIWHYHNLNGKLQNYAIVHFGGAASTELIKGKVEKIESKRNPKKKNLRGFIDDSSIKEALNNGAERFSLPSWQAGYFDGDTVHARSEFVSEEPRLVAVITFKN